jgi:pilus assembly protein FimV
LLGGLFAVLAGALGFAAVKRRQREQADELESFGEPAMREPAMHETSPVLGQRKAREESFVVEESGVHRAPTMPPAAPAGPVEAPSPDDTMSTESAVNFDQGDPLAEADFHMAYGLYDQAADLVRIALEREPERRDLRLKLLEIYFVWGNKDLFLQTAKSLYETRDHAPAGEWDKIVIMGKQICPDDPLFAHADGGGRAAGAAVDLNLEGGENRVDVDLFGEPSGEHSPHEPPVAKDADDTAATGESPRLHGDSGLDFVLDAPERGADESPTRELPQRDEPTVESEIMPFAEPPVAEPPTAESPALAPEAADAARAAQPKAATVDQTAEVSIDDLGLDLEGLEQTGRSESGSASHLEPTDASGDSATMVAGLDERSRRMIAEAESRTQDRDLTDLERELEASFIADLDSSHTEIKTAILPPDAVPTMQLPQPLRETEDGSATSQVPSLKDTEPGDVAARLDPDSTSRLRSVGEGLDLDLDRLAGALGGDTLEQPRAAEDVFSSEVFETSQSSTHSAIDLDVGAPLHEDAGTGLTTLRPDEATMPPMEGETPTEFEPVTMSEVGTKLDLARAYMDMGDPEGARSILDEVVQEGSASQQQEAQRLLHSLPG